MELAAQLPPEAASMLLQFEERLLLNPEEWGHVCGTGTVAGCYTDPKLRHSQGAYRGFVRRLYGAGLLRVVRRARCRVGCFFAPKKDGRVRLV
eukprot:6503886-Lingulodinium_polyedra.AAC.1